MTEKTLSDGLREEEELLRRRLVHHAGPRGPLSMDDAIALSKRMAGETRPPDEPTNSGA